MDEDKKKIPFDEDVMTIILGLGDPMKPGMHGPRTEPMPDPDIISGITQIRDLCDDLLEKIGKPNEQEGEKDDVQGMRKQSKEDSGQEGGEEQEEDSWQRR